MPPERDLEAGAPPAAPLSPRKRDAVPPARAGGGAGGRPPPHGRRVLDRVGSKTWAADADLTGRQPHPTQVQPLAVPSLSVGSQRI